MAARKDRYTAVAITLHWLIALGIIGQILAGWWMVNAIDSPDQFIAALAVFQLHKSVGLTILALSFARLGWRLAHTVPPLPAAMPGWEKFSARAVHVLFYVVMIAAPLTGWAYASTGWSVEKGHAFSVPTVWFGLVRIPHIPGLIALPDAPRAAAAGGLHFAHEKLAWLAIALLTLHVGAALKHHFIDRDDVLTRMLPFLKPADDARSSANPSTEGA